MKYSFEINFDDLNRTCEFIKNKKKNLDLNIIDAFKDSKKSNLYWNDSNQQIFSELVKVDEYNYNQLSENIDDLLNQISRFYDIIIYIIKKYNSEDLCRTLKFDSNKNTLALENLGDSISDIEKAKDKLERLNIPFEFCYRDEIKFLSGILTQINNKQVGLSRKIKKIDDQIILELEKSKFRINKIPDVVFEINDITYE